MAKIGQARIIAAHDGVAELLLTIVYDNGGSTDVTLDSTAADALLRSCDATDIEDVTGHDWEKVRDALTHSYNRFR